VKMDVDMLAPVVQNWVLGERDGGLVVDVEHRRGDLLVQQVGEQSREPHALTCR
jgi:hypothetical protein